MTQHVVIDLETWGNLPGYDLRSIGACVIDPINNVISDNRFFVALKNPLQGSYSSDHFTDQDLDALDYRTGALRKYPLLRDPKTVAWWYNETTQAARDQFIGACDLLHGLLDFTRWLQSLGVVVDQEHSGRIWGHGAAYDPPILAAAYEAVGLPTPWHYRATRDTRTLFDNAGITNHSAHMKAHRQGTFHHAGDDALSEGGAILSALQIIRQLHQMHRG